MTRVVVVGSGIAGLTAALHAAAAGADVTIATKAGVAEGSTRWAQGGIAAVTAPDDSTAAHLADTLTAGAGIGDEAAAALLVTDAAERIAELQRLGVAFDRDATGGLARGLEAAHSAPRVLHAGGDATGAAIEAALVAGVRDAGIEVVERAFLVDLVLAAGAVAGVLLLVDGAPRMLPADAVILATGGAGGLYSRTTNPAVVTGDGIAAALRAGARVADLEFVQFHPTVLATGAPFLISEAVRGAGAVLRDETGRRFAFDAHPDGELAPRDVVARAIARTMAVQNGRPALLDATALGAAFLARRFPTIDRAVRERGLDWSREPVPVTPAAHYLMGGVVTDRDGRTSIPGLFAAGEAARTGVHGANRLASNSLLEGAVFGARAGAAAAAAPFAVSTVGGGADGGASAAHRPVSRPSPTFATAAPSPFSRAALQQLMWRDAGMLRDARGLERAASTLAGWRAAATAPTTLAEHENANLLLVASAVVDAARRRSASVGAHFRLDDAPAARRTQDEPALSAEPPGAHPPLLLNSDQEAVAAC